MRFSGWYTGSSITVSSEQHKKSFKEHRWDHCRVIGQTSEVPNHQIRKYVPISPYTLIKGFLMKYSYFGLDIQTVGFEVQMKIRHSVEIAFWF